MSPEPKHASAPEQRPADGAHYLKRELDALFGGNSELVEFLGVGCLDGLWYWDLDAPEHEWMNERFWRILGHDPRGKAHLAAEWQDMIFPSDLVTAFENFRRHCDDPSRPYDQIVRYRHADGSTVWVRCRGVAIRDEAGRPVRMLGVHTDVTELKRREAALTEANARLERFAALASHDLQAPLRRSLLCVDIINRELGSDLNAASEPLRRALRTLRSNGEQMRDLVRGLTEFASLQTHTPQMTRVSLDEVVRDALVDAEPALAAADASLALSALPSIDGDPELLRRLFAALIENACQFRSEAPLEIAISAEIDGGAARVRVADTGVGVPPDEADRIFEPFVRLHRRDQSGGVGVGLAMCKTIAALHRGSIACARDAAVGARFEMRLPVDARHGC